ncbi:MAG: hypothetical protein HYY52_06545 [Candidatus Melainabacteria bacterium]|nr:hypothetical protein [Candidatus Melainabacteria bacterium]
MDKLKVNPPGIDSKTTTCPVTPAGSPNSRSETVTRYDSDSQTSNLTSERVLGNLTRLLKEQFNRSKPVLSLKEYTGLVLERPDLRLRPISKYALDAINYVEREYGPGKTVRVLGRDLKEYKFLEMPWKSQSLQNIERFRGHLLFVDRFIRKLEAFSTKPHPDRAVLIHGPNSTGKSSFLDKLFALLEYYSHTDEGALYTLSWAFDDKLSEFGFHSNKNGYSSEELINPQDVIVTILSNKNSIPFFVLDIEQRAEILDLLEASGKLPSGFNTDFVLSYKLDDMSKKIFDGLLTLYGGNPDSVYRHMQVVRWYFSSTGDRGLVLKQPTDAPNTILQQITPTTNWERLPHQIINVLSNAGLHTLEGPLSQANHGIIYYDDMFRGIERHRGLNDYLWILRLAEKGETTVASTDGINTTNEQFDILTIGTANDNRLRDIESIDGENWQALQPRLELLEIGHERCYGYVAELFRDKLPLIIPPNTKRHVSPNVIDTLALWVTMTHLFPYGNEAYYNSSLHDTSVPLREEAKQTLKTLLRGMSPLEIALLYQDANLNVFELDPSKVKYDSQAQKLLHDNARYKTDEYNLSSSEHSLDFYEGCIGLPTRTAEDILTRAAQLNQNESLTVIELFRAVDDAIRRGFRFEMERNELATRVNSEAAKKDKQASLGRTNFTLPKFPSSQDLLTQAKEYAKRKIRFDVCKAISLIKTNEEIKHELKRYLAHLKALLRSENVPSEWREPKHQLKPNEQILELLENIFEIEERYRDKFRRDTLSEIGSWQLTNSDRTAIDHIDEVLPNLTKKLEAAYAKENAKDVKNFLTDLRELLESKKSAQIENDEARSSILHNGIIELQKMGYTEEIMLKEIFFAFDSDYLLYLDKLIQSKSSYSI